MNVSTALNKVKTTPNKAKRLYGMWRDAVPKPNITYPTIIQFPINDICNSRCQMCYIWENKRGKEITPDEVRTSLNKDVFKKVRAVGLNGGEPTLRKDIGELAEALCNALPSLDTLNLITNAWKDALCIKRIEALVEVAKRRGKNFDVMVSIDGVGEVHNAVRGREGNFDAACRVIEFCKQHPDIRDIRIGCTIIKENIFAVEELLEWAIETNTYARFRVGVPHQRLYNKDHTNLLANQDTLQADERYHLAAFLDTLRLEYEQDPLRQAFYLSLRNQVIYGADRAAGCMWKNKGITLLSDGKLAYCAVESKALGSVIEEDASSLFWQNEDHLKEIQDNKCATCMHDYEGFADRKLLHTVLAKRVYNKLPTAAQNTAFRTLKSLQTAKDSLRVKRTDKQFSQIVRPNSGSKVLIIGWYGTETTGDKAILAGIINSLYNINPDTTIDVAALEQFVTQETARQMPELNIQHVHNLNTAKIAIQQGDYDLVIMGGGPLMSPIRQVIDMHECFNLAKQVGTKTMIAGCGVGPLDQSKSMRARNKAITAMLQQADSVLLRDEASKITAQEQLNITRSIDVTLDPAALWVAETAKQTTRKDNVLLALRDWPIEEYAQKGLLNGQDPQTIKQKFEQEVLTFVEAVQQQSPTTKIIPVCMHTYTVGGDDRRFYKRLFKNHPLVLENLSNAHHAPQKTVKQFCEARAVLSMRFHSAVFALATNTPFLAVDYTLGGKVTGLLKQNNQQDALLPLLSFNGAEAAKDLLAKQNNEGFEASVLNTTRVTLEDHLSALLPRKIPSKTESLAAA